jgi:hypothetical protein
VTLVRRAVRPPAKPSSRRFCLSCAPALPRSSYVAAPPARCMYFTRTSHGSLTRAGGTLRGIAAWLRHWWWSGGGALPCLLPGPWLDKRATPGPVGCGRFDQESDFLLRSHFALCTNIMHAFPGRSRSTNCPAPTAYLAPHGRAKQAAPPSLWPRSLAPVLLTKPATTPSACHP